MSGSRRVALVASVLTLVVVLGVGAVALFVPGHRVDGSALAAAPTTTSPVATTDPPTSPEEDVRVVVAKDGKSQVTVPRSWVSLPKSATGGDFQLAYGKPFEELYVAVITHTKQDFADFDTFANLMTEAPPGLTDFDQLDTENTELGGMRAYRVQFTGTYEGLKAAFWVTAARGEKAYYHVLAWTLRSKMKTAERPILTVVDSFRETVKEES